MNTVSKGHLAVLKVEERVMELGWTASKPTTEADYDLILDDHGRLYRVQVKYADGAPSRSTGSSGAIVASFGHRKNGSEFRHETYTKDQIDAILVYAPKIEKVLWFGPDVFETRRTISLRIAPTKNLQTRGLHLVEAYVW